MAMEGELTRSILSLTATTQAVTCSAAFPTIGIKIRPMKFLLIFPVATIASMLSTR